MLVLYHLLILVSCELSAQYTCLPVYTSILYTSVQKSSFSVHINLFLYTLAILRSKLCLYSVVIG